MNSQDFPPLQVAADHLLTIIQRVHASDYGRSDPRLLLKPSDDAAKKLLEMLHFDMDSFLQHASQSKFIEEFKNEWGLVAESPAFWNSRQNAVSPASDNALSNFSISKKVSLRILRLLKRAVQAAASTMNRFKGLEQHDAGTVLVYMFVTDVIGRNTPEGKMFDCVVNDSLVYIF